LRKLNDIIGIVLLYGFFAVAAITPVVILVLSILNFVRNAPRRLAIVLKALAALMIWSFLTFTIIMVFIMIVFSYPVQSETNSLALNGIFALQGLIYLVIGLVLIYWMKRQGRRIPGV
jgi:hypothetical protein